MMMMKQRCRILAVAGVAMLFQTASVSASFTFNKDSVGIWYRFTHKPIPQDRPHLTRDGIPAAPPRVANNVIALATKFEVGTTQKFRAGTASQQSSNWSNLPDTNCAGRSTKSPRILIHVPIQDGVENAKTIHLSKEEVTRDYEVTPVLSPITKAIDLIRNKDTCTVPAQELQATEQDPDANKEAEDSVNNQGACNALIQKLQALGANEEDITDLVENWGACKTLIKFLKQKFTIGDWVIAPKNGATNKKGGFIKAGDKTRYFYKRTPGKVVDINISGESGKIKYVIEWRKQEDPGFEFERRKLLTPVAKLDKLIKLEDGELKNQCNNHDCQTGEATLAQVKQKYEMYKLQETLTEIQKDMKALDRDDRKFENTESDEDRIIETLTHLLKTVDAKYRNPTYHALVRMLDFAIEKSVDDTDAKRKERIKEKLKSLLKTWRGLLEEETNHEKYNERTQIIDQITQKHFGGRRRLATMDRLLKEIHRAQNA